MKGKERGIVRWLRRRRGSLRLRRRGGGTSRSCLCGRGRSSSVGPSHRSRRAACPALSIYASVSRCYCCCCFLAERRIPSWSLVGMWYTFGASGCGSLVIGIENVPAMFQCHENPPAMTFVPPLSPFLIRFAYLHPKPGQRAPTWRGHTRRHQQPGHELTGRRWG